MNSARLTNDLIRQIYERNANTAFRIALNNVRSTVDAEDIVQAVFLKLVQKQVMFNDAEHEKAWIIRVTINKCKDFHKSFSKKKSVPYNDSLLNSEDVEISDNDILVHEEIKKLPSDYQNVLYLYYFEKYTTPEIAKILKKSENTIKTQLRRSRN